MDEAIEIARQKEEHDIAFVMGGASVYEESLRRIEIRKMFLTRVHTNIFKSDQEDRLTLFPDVDWSEWTEYCPKLNRCHYGLRYTFEEYFRFAA